MNTDPIHYQPAEEAPSVELDQVPGVDHEDCGGARRVDEDTRRDDPDPDQTVVDGHGDYSA